MDNAVYCHATKLASPLHRIGAGFCGSVWSDIDAAPGSVAIKREDGGQGRSLKNDSDIHQRLLAACNSGVGAFSIPLWHGFISMDNAKELVPRFPLGYTPCNILLTERILPLPKPIQYLLINKYCPPTLVSSIAADPNNDDCLVRPYLGKRRGSYRNSKFRVFSLRNFPLHLDQIEELSLDAYAYSLRMAKALAFMHWSARVDANDIEFVLAPARAGGSVLSTMHSPVLGNHCLWVLDFDCCRSMTMDTVGLKQAACAFWRNDPFYPRPGKECQEDIRLWVHFKQSYLEASFDIIGTGDAQRHDLPSLLIDMIEAKPFENGHRHSTSPIPVAPLPP
ncbi:zinc finger protein-domain-containing protein [Xylariaceae sp. AK1471]|nr:zinc finger protein-domain-containing protein [Xylariaceae sp. AK1471]